MSSPPNDDAQRDMEQRALRNVRALVDKYEDSDARESRSTRRLVIGVVAFILVGFIAVLGYLQFTKRTEPGPALILPPPAKAPR